MWPNFYTTAIKFVLKLPGLSLMYLLHVERGIMLGALKIEVVGILDKRASRLWLTDVFGSYYATKLPIPGMREISGHDARRGPFSHLGS